MNSNKVSHTYREWHWEDNTHNQV